MFALIYLLGPIPGINYTHTIDEYGQRAIQLMTTEVMRTPPFGIVSARYIGWDYYTIATRTYDWIWSALTADQRTQTANWLADSGSLVLSNWTLGMVSSPYFEGFYPWEIGLGFYNDGVRQDVAQALVDSFEKGMLNGRALDFQNWIARSNGGNSELGTYGLSHPYRHIISLDEWRTATGQNYFAEGTGIIDANFVRYYPQYILYRLKPSNPKVLLKWGEISSGVGFNGTGGGEDMMAILGEPLKIADPDMAALNRWFSTALNIIPPYDTDYSLFMRILFADKSVSPKSPQELNLPLTQFFEGIGMVIMRSGFNDLQDTAIAIGAPVYRIGGHDWYNGQFPLGFTIDKYGPLAFKHHGDKSEQIEHRQNIMRFTDPLATPDAGWVQGQGSSPSNMQDYTPSSKWYRGGVTRLETVENTGSYDYVFADVRRNYLTSRVSNYTRQYVYLRPQSLIDSDYIVIFDRTETTRPDILKRWEINMAYNPQINGAETQIQDGKWQYTGANQITITNDIDPDPYSKKISPEAHGKLFVRTLLPQSVTLEKNGGPGNEFMTDAGGVNQNINSDYKILNAAGALYVGTYFVDIIPAVPSLKDNFLHILQTADANNPAQSTAMTPTERIDGDMMVGAHIKDDTLGHKVVMFSKTEANQAHVEYSISTSQPVEHLIADLAPFGTYDVFQDGNKLATLSASEAGTISFNSTGGGSFNVSSNALPPTVVASAAPVSGNAPLSVSFTAVATDLDGTIQSYNWSFGDNTPNSTQQNPSHTYSLNGTYQATVTVTDDSGLSATSIPITITVTLPPQVTASADVTSGQTPLTVNFTAIGQNIVSYLWNFGDSQTSTQQNPSHVYQNSGTYTVTVTGTDSIGKTTTDSLSIAVAGTLTTITVSPNVVFVLPNGTQQFSALGKDSVGNTIPISLTWAVSGGGMIDANGLFSAGTTEGTFTVSTTDGSISGTASITISSNIFENGLIGYWTLDEGAGQTAQDASGNGHQGTISGATWTMGKVRGALDFDGSNDYVNVGALPFNSFSSFTHSAWFKANTLNEYRRIISTQYSGGDDIRLWVDGRTLYYSLDDGTVSQVTTSFSDSSSWHHVAGTFDGSKIRLYLDGIEVGTPANDTFNFAGTNGTTYIGKQVGSSDSSIHFAGLIDDVRIYNRALSDAEIQTLFNPPQPPQQPPQITLTKTADKTEVTQGDTITYTILYKNEGASDAINVVITDPIPSGIVYVDKSATQGGAYNTNKNEIQWTIPTLAPNASGSVSFQAMVE